MAWMRAELLHRMLPDSRGIVLGVALGDDWRKIAPRDENWFSIDERGRTLRRTERDGEIRFEAPDERPTPGEDICGFELRLVGRGANLEVVRGIAADLRASFRERFGLRSQNEGTALYNLPLHPYNERLVLWTEELKSPDAAVFKIWTDLG